MSSWVSHNKQCQMGNELDLRDLWKVAAKLIMRPRAGPKAPGNAIWALSISSYIWPAHKSFERAKTNAPSIVGLPQML